MTATWWRLLGALSLAAAAVISLHGQDLAADRLATVPGLSSSPGERLEQKFGPSDPRVIPRPYPVPRIAIDLPQIAHSAGIIFSGRVLSIRRDHEQSTARFANSGGFTSITFQVEHAIRGASVGQPLTIHEWAGLWSNGERYRIGERVFLFLYPPSKLGLTSPVAGARARFAVDTSGKIVINPSNFGSFGSDPKFPGTNRVPYADFVRAIRRASAEE